jgi:glycosyltransferase involved in cell wall biosynthesis
MKTIFFLVSTLEGGGAERVVLNILKHLDRKKFKPVLVLFEKKGELLPELPPDIPLETLKAGGSRYGLQWLIFFRLAALLKKERPEAVVSFMWYPNLISLLAKLVSGVRCRVIVSERYALSFSFEGRFTEFLRSCAIRLFYRRADVIVTNSEAMAEEFRQIYSIPGGSLAVIHNPLDIKRVRSLGKEEASHPWFHVGVPVITSSGRLTRQKGFDTLLKALKMLLSGGTVCRLMILGKGPEKERLENLAIELGIGGNVAFPGFQENPWKYVARSRLFVLPSLYEGFPNALLEAIALGVPSVATRCPTGPEEIITDGENGLLVPSADEGALAHAIQQLLLDEGLRKRLSEAGVKRSEAFSVEKIVRQYEDLIEGVCAGSAAE